jgi:hypothetical protein
MKQELTSESNQEKDINKIYKRSFASREETQIIKKALIELIDRISEKDRARVYAVAVDILEGKQTVSITKDEIIKLIDQHTSKLLLTDE